MIDLHTHVLPGIDDGPVTIEESVALIRAAAAGGTRVIVATPHVSGHYPNSASAIARLTRELNQRLREEQIAVEVRAGAEIAMTKVAEIESQELERLHLAGGPWLLLEPPFSQLASGLERTVRELQRNGHRVVLAHPERCPALHREPQLVRTLVEAGVLTSLTAGSLTGRFGGQVRRFAQLLVEQDLVHNVASDTHDLLKRPPDMLAELERGGLADLSDWLTEAVPAAILAGKPIPGRPAGRSRSQTRSWWRLGRPLKRAS